MSIPFELRIIYSSDSPFNGAWGGVFYYKNKIPQIADYK